MSRDSTHPSRFITSRLIKLAACVLAIACAIVLAQDGATELTPERRARLQWEAGYVLHQLGEYERALEYDPQYLPALLGLGFIRRGGLQGL